MSQEQEFSFLSNHLNYYMQRSWYRIFDQWGQKNTASTQADWLQSPILPGPETLQDPDLSRADCSWPLPPRIQTLSTTPLLLLLKMTPWTDLCCTLMALCSFRSSIQSKLLLMNIVYLSLCNRLWHVVLQQLECSRTLSKRVTKELWVEETASPRQHGGEQAVVLV